MKTIILKRIPSDLHNAIKVKAAQEDVTMKEIIIRAVEAYLNIKRKEG